MVGESRRCKAKEPCMHGDSLRSQLEPGEVDCMEGIARNKDGGKDSLVKWVSN